MRLLKLIFHVFLFLYNGTAMPSLKHIKSIEDSATPIPTIIAACINGTGIIPKVAADIGVAIEKAPSLISLFVKA